MNEVKFPLKKTNYDHNGKSFVEHLTDYEQGFNDCKNEYDEVLEKCYIIPKDKVNLKKIKEKIYMFNQFLDDNNSIEGISYEDYNELAQSLHKMIEEESR